MAALRRVAKRAVDGSCLRGVARAVDMAPDTLRRFLDGEASASGTPRMSPDDETAQPLQPTGELTRAEADRLLWALVSGVPAKRQPAAVRKVIRTLLALYGAEPPEWLIGLPAPARGPSSRVIPAPAPGLAGELERAEDHEAFLRAFRGFVRDELRFAGVAPEVAEELIAEVFRRYAEAEWTRDTDVVRARLFRIARRVAAQGSPDAATGQRQTAP